MLIHFSLTNYKNFKETQALDLTEGKISEHARHLLKSPIDRLGILPAAVIYGPNGSGKTNLLKALWHLRTLVLDAPSVWNEDCAFCFDPASQKSPTEYEIIFRVEQMEYNYQLKMTPRGLTEENLFARRLQDSFYDVVFDRDGEGIFLCPALEDLDVSALTDQQPFLYFLSLSRKKQRLQPVFDFFQNMIFLSDSSVSLEMEDIFLRAKANREELLALLQTMTPSITDLRIHQKEISFVHTIQEKSLTLSWDAEASGICQLLIFAAALLQTRKNGALLLADTPELHLHPMILEKLYLLCTNQEKNPHGSQLLAVTHENSTMNNGIFRRDELWITAPQADGSSLLYPLSLYLKKNGEKVRKDETYSKQYLEGRYGGLPDIV